MDVRSCEQRNFAQQYFVAVVMYEESTSDNFDWQPFRTEAAKDILAGILAHANICIAETEKTRLTKLALSYTEELIRQLKEKEEK